MTTIANTGERIILEKETPLMIARHFSAYRFAAGHVHNKVVLDIGCGEGYGSYHLANSAREVLGIDYDKTAIEYAENRYQRKNLRFTAMDVKDIDLLRNKYDVICSFQVIEHISDAGIFLGKVKNLLNEGGVFICSTPNKQDASPNSSTPLNKFHVREYLYEEFEELLGPYFRDVEIVGLKRDLKINFFRRLKKIGVFNFLPQGMNPVNRFYSNISCDNFVITKNKVGNALDFIAKCAKNGL